MKKHAISVLSLFGLLLVLSTGLVSCGGGADTSGTDGETAEAPKSMIDTGGASSEPISVSADGSTVTVNLTGNDMMKYNLEKIEVKAGQTIKLNLTHVGKMDKAVMGHNFTLLKEGVDLVDFATKAATSSENDYIPEGEEDKIIAHTKMLGGGESTSIEFEAPGPGTYKFVCTFPGHYATMQGDFIVE